MKEVKELSISSNDGVKVTFTDTDGANKTEDVDDFSQELISCFVTTTMFVSTQVVEYRQEIDSLKKEISLLKDRLDKIVD